MAEQTTILQLVLDRLQLGNSISTISERIALQKVVCLTQEAGLQLGYSFNWYMRGPYSPALASDYYLLASMQQDVENEAKKFVLNDSAKAAVDRVAVLLSPPAGVALDRVGWLELVASIAFLMKRYRLGVEAAKQKINMSKPALAPNFNAALQQLQQAGFMLG